MSWAGAWISSLIIELCFVVFNFASFDLFRKECIPHPLAALLWVGHSFRTPAAQLAMLNLLVKVCFTITKCFIVSKLLADKYKTFCLHHNKPRRNIHLLYLYKECMRNSFLHIIKGTTTSPISKCIGTGGGSSGNGFPATCVALSSLDRYSAMRPLGVSNMDVSSYFQTLCLPGSGPTGISWSIQQTAFMHAVSILSVINTSWF